MIILISELCELARAVTKLVKKYYEERYGSY